MALADAAAARVRRGAARARGRERVDRLGAGKLLRGRGPPSRKRGSAASEARWTTGSAVRLCCPPARCAAATDRGARRGSAAITPRGVARRKASLKLRSRRRTAQHLCLQVSGVKPVQVKRLPRKAADRQTAHHRPNGPALKHVRRPAHVGAHGLQPSAQLMHPSVTPPVLQAASHVGHKNISKQRGPALGPAGAAPGTAYRQWHGGRAGRTRQPSGAMHAGRRWPRSRSRRSPQQP